MVHVLFNVFFCFVFFLCVFLCVCLSVCLDITISVSSLVGFSSLWLFFSIFFSRHVYFDTVLNMLCFSNILFVEPKFQI